MSCIYETMDQTFQEDLELIAKTDLPWEKLRGARVLVTGATGLVGKAFVLALLAANRILDTKITILALVRSRERGEQVFGGAVSRPRLRLVIGDVLEPINVEGRVDYVIHLASQTASKEFVTHPVETIETSICGTKNVLELARAKKCKSVVYVSSMEMYGDPGERPERIREDMYGYIDPLSVRSCYPEGKRMCECLCACYCSEYGIPVKIARLAQTFGAGVSKNENRVFAQFARSAIEKKDIVLHTAGQSYGNYCYTADVVTGLLTILLKGENGGAYNVVSEAATMRIAEMAQLVAEKIAGGEIKIVFDIPKSNTTYGYAPDVVLRLSGEKLRELGWAPVIAPRLEDMYVRLIESMK